MNWLDRKQFLQLQAEFYYISPGRLFQVFFWIDSLAFKAQAPNRASTADFFQLEGDRDLESSVLNPTGSKTGSKTLDPS